MVSVRVRRSPALSAVNARRDRVNFSGQCRKIDVLLDLGQRIADPVDLFTVMFAGKEVVFNRATLLNGTELSGVSGCSILSQGYRCCERGFSRCPKVNA